LDVFILYLQFKNNMYLFGKYNWLLVL